VNELLQRVHRLENIQAGRNPDDGIAIPFELHADVPLPVAEMAENIRKMLSDLPL